MALIFDLGGHGACGWCESSSSINIPSLKFVGLAIRKIWHTMCVSINGPGHPDLWPFDLETGMRVESKVMNLPSKFGHARPFGSRIIRYVRDGRTVGRTDGQKQRLLPPFLPVGAKQEANIPVQHWHKQMMLYTNSRPRPVTNSLDGVNSPWLLCT